MSTAQTGSPMGSDRLRTGETGNLLQEGHAGQLACARRRFLGALRRTTREGPSDRQLPRALELQRLVHPAALRRLPIDVLARGAPLVLEVPCVVFVLRPHAQHDRALLEVLFVDLGLLLGDTHPNQRADEPASRGPSGSASQRTRQRTRDHQADAWERDRRRGSHDPQDGGAYGAAHGASNTGALDSLVAVLDLHVLASKVL